MTIGSFEDDGTTAWFQARVAAEEFSGVALAWRNGAPVFSYAGGIADRRYGTPVGPDSRFAVASVTKLVVAATCLRLVDAGAVDLRRPLTTLLPVDQQPDALTEAHTLHHLLSHTSGLPNYHDDDDPTWASFTAAWDRVPTYHARHPRDLLPLFRHAPAFEPPGERYRYADSNFLLAALVIEAVTGRSWAQVAAEEVLDRVGMSDTDVPYLDHEPARLATGYLRNDGPGPAWKSNVFSVPAGGMPDGGLVTTAEDLARLLDALEDGRLLSPASHSAMTGVQIPPRPGFDHYGYGCQLGVEDGEVTVVGHEGADPGVSAAVYRYRRAATSIVVLCNRDGGAWPALVRLGHDVGVHEPRAASIPE